ncbi:MULTISPECIES: prepilin-type N-terminal cleavage/methylation domain-containing protein [unclassified Rhodanobacter]|uniref:Prepilin-type N-terminal cleavage/methylation domain-containing protein n=1 Tax=Rhodanobacter humi TaxID=1888173 RepID=A0ABV4AM76_9GAMM
MKNINYQNKKKKGFALTEVLLSIAVIVIIGIVAYPLYASSRDAATVEKIRNEATMVLSSADTSSKSFRSQAMSDGQYFDVMKYFEATGQLPEGLTHTGFGIMGERYAIDGTDWTMEYNFLPDGRSNMWIAAGNDGQKQCIPLFKTFAAMTKGQLVLNNGTAPYYYVSGEPIDTAKLTAACAVDPYGYGMYTFLFDSSTAVSYH